MYSLFDAYGTEAIEQAQRDTGEKYTMELNPSDFSTILHSLIDTAANCEREGLADAALDLYSSIAQSLGIELV